MENNEQLIRRYLLEKGIKNRCEIDKFAFEMWLNRFNKYNICFGRAIKSEGLLTDEPVIEVCSDENYNVSKKIIMPNERKIIVSKFGLSSKRNCLTQIGKGYVLANGVFADAKSSLLNTGARSFSVGVCGDSKCEYIQKMISDYKKLREQLISLGIKNIKTFEETDGSTVIYVLNHIEDGKVLVKEYQKPVVQRISER